jgi:hypothetical protein
MYVCVYIYLYAYYICIPRSLPPLTLPPLTLPPSHSPPTNHHKDKGESKGTAEINKDAPAFSVKLDVLLEVLFVTGGGEGWGEGSYSRGTAL